MIKPCAGEAGEGVDDATDFRIVVEDDKRVNRIVIHRLSRLNDLRIAVDGLGVAGHDLRYRRSEERLPEAQHRTTDVSIGHDAHKLI